MVFFVASITSSFPHEVTNVPEKDKIVAAATTKKHFNKKDKRYINLLTF